MFPLLILAFILVPIAEIAFIIRVGEWLGFWWTAALLIADSVLGSILVKSQGRAVWRRFSEALRLGRAPTNEVVDGALVLVGGTLLLLPGFLTDFVGVAFLLPPSRSVVRRVLVARVRGRASSSLSGRPTGRWRNGR